MSLRVYADINNESVCDNCDTGIDESENVYCATCYDDDQTSVAGLPEWLDHLASALAADQSQQWLINQVCDVRDDLLAGSVPAFSQLMLKA